MLVNIITDPHVSTGVTSASAMRGIGELYATPVSFPFPPAGLAFPLLSGKRIGNRHPFVVISYFEVGLGALF